MVPCLVAAMRLFKHSHSARSDKSWIVAALVLALGASMAVAGEPSPPKVDFNHDIQPIFSKRCYSCHGPESAEGSLRLDRKADALRGGNSGPAFKPGQSSESRIISFVTGENEDEMVMPPEGERLSTTEVALIRSWIDQGAIWPDEPQGVKRGSDHWAFQPIQQPPLPKVSDSAWLRNPIDAFVLAKLDAQGIKPSPEADPATLCRRLYLDLTGLPPSPADVDEFVRAYSSAAGAREAAYNALVDKILASPHYGERQARHWLDLARYADSDGYEKDTGRPFAWRYRHWVIDAFNRDLSFADFTRQQLAGDLLPEGDVEQLVATGFHRNTLTNREGGVDQEEFRVAATVDRVNTTGSVWLGLTVGCAQCHTHKYDPIAQREYYGLFAFLNSLREVDVPAPLPEQVAAYVQAQAKFEATHAPLVAELKKYEETQLAASAAKWEQSLDKSSQTTWTTVQPATLNATIKLTLKPQGDGVVMAVGDRGDISLFTITAPTELKRITALRVEALTSPDLPKRGPGRAYNGNFVLSEVTLTVISPAAKDAADTKDADKKPVEKKIPLRYAAADFEQPRFGAAQAIDGDVKTGWAVGAQVGRDHALVVEAKEPVDVPPGSTIKITLDHQYRGEHILGRFRLALTDAATPVGTEQIQGGITAALAVLPEKRSEAQRKLLLDYYRPLDAEWVKLSKAVAEHAKKAPADPGLANKAQTLDELPTPRKTNILVKGDFLRPGAAVEPHVLEVLHPLKPRDNKKPDRLDLADWLLDPANPLTARVVVNRFWEQHFGRGLVATSSDFGTQGEKPSHPELLDWLAMQFMQGSGGKKSEVGGQRSDNYEPTASSLPSPASPWSMKALHKLIVTSATYRQSSATRPDLADRDAYNILLARQRRLRVEAEIVRDVSLAASGLLNEAVGGPSVRPRQPEGVSELTYAGSAKWVESKGAERHRRGLYTWFQRTSPYPMLMTFDAPDSNVACLRRERSNTPLQALTLLNDPVFFECAQALGRRIVKEAPSANLDDRLTHAFRLCLSRSPSEAEAAGVKELYNAQLAFCTSDAKAAENLVGKELPQPGGVAVPELAAWVIVGRTLMNLDEFITRE